MAQSKEKKYIIDNTALMAEWDFEKNKLAGHFQETTALHSNKKNVVEMSKRTHLGYVSRQQN